jgi:hypothetical protein
MPDGLPEPDQAAAQQAREAAARLDDEAGQYQPLACQKALQPSSNVWASQAVLTD